MRLPPSLASGYPSYSQDGSFHGLHHVSQRAAVIDLGGAKVSKLHDAIARHKDIASLDVPAMNDTGWGERRGVKDSAGDYLRAVCGQSSRRYPHAM